VSREWIEIRPWLRSPLPGTLGALFRYGLDGLELAPINDGRSLARQGLGLDDDLSGKKPVAKELNEPATPKLDVSADLPVRRIVPFQFA
jgi:hypothetical protein